MARTNCFSWGPAMIANYGQSALCYPSGPDVGQAALERRTAEYIFCRPVLSGNGPGVSKGKYEFPTVEVQEIQVSAAKGVIFKDGLIVELTEGKSVMGRRDVIIFCFKNNLA